MTDPKLAGFALIIRVIAVLELHRAALSIERNVHYSVFCAPDQGLSPVPPDHEQAASDIVAI